MSKRKKDEQTFADDILNIMGVAILIVFGLVTYSFMLENETLSQFLSPDNWAEFSIIAVILIAIYCLISFFNREVV